MLEKVINILTDNNIYENEAPLILSRSNNLEEFFNNFNIASFKNQKNIFNQNIQRDKNGFINLEDFPFIYSNKIENVRNSWLLFNNGARVLLKNDIENREIEQELMIMYFLKSLNIACASYEPVLLNGNKYLATPSLLKLDEKFIDPEYSTNIGIAYNEAKKYNNELHYLKTVFADLIYGGTDRFPGNYKLIKNKNTSEIRTCPLLDNAEYLFEKNFNEYTPHLENGSYDINEIISYLLNYEAIMYWVINPVKKTNLQNVAKRLKREKNFIVSNITYKRFENYFKDSEAVINEELKNKGSNKRIKLT